VHSASPAESRGKPSFASPHNYLVKHMIRLCRFDALPPPHFTRPAFPPCAGQRSMWLRPSRGSSISRKFRGLAGETEPRNDHRGSASPLIQMAVSEWADAVRSSPNSPLEGTGFEFSVPRGLGDPRHEAAAYSFYQRASFGSPAVGNKRFRARERRRMVLSNDAGNCSKSKNQGACPRRDHFGSVLTEIRRLGLDTSG
jgi:hypothetical protein